jgi:hypothetical protein
LLKFFFGESGSISHHNNIYVNSLAETKADETTLFSTVRWLYTRTWLHDEPPSRLFDRLVLWLKERKILLPGITTLEKLINHIRDQAARRIWARLDKQLTEAQRQTLQTLVTTENREQTTLDRLRDGPTVISSNALKAALERIKELRRARIGGLDVSWLAPDRLKKLARYAGLSKADTINRLDVPRKWATLAAFVHAYETRATSPTSAKGLFAPVISSSACAPSCWLKPRTWDWLPLSMPPIVIYVTFVKPQSVLFPNLITG